MRYLDLSGVDRIELEDAWADLLARFRTDCAGQVEGYFVERDDVRWGPAKRAEIADDVAGLVIAWMTSRKKWFEEYGPPALVDFIEDLDRRGFDLVPRRPPTGGARPRKYKLRHPRVKRLKAGVSSTSPKMVNSPEGGSRG